MKYLVKIIVSFSFLMSSYCFSGAVEGVVIKLAIDRIYTTDKVFVQVAGDKQIPEGGCHTNTSWSFALPLNTERDRAIYAMLLSAHATGKPALLEGRDSCDVHSSIESLEYIKY